MTITGFGFGVFSRVLKALAWNAVWEHYNVLQTDIQVQSLLGMRGQSTQQLRETEASHCVLLSLSLQQEELHDHSL